MLHEIIHIIVHTLLDTLKIVPFLFCAFLIIEFIEHKLSKKSKNMIEKSGKLGPLFGGLVGILPQCGFSVLATNLYVTRIITLGTLIAIYLATSDEMLAILISRQTDLSIIIKLLSTKFIIGVLFGFIIDFVVSRYRKNNKIKVKEDYTICDDEHCHCGKNNLFYSSINHTFKTFIFIFIVSFVLNMMMEFLGNDFISNLFMKDSIFSPFISSLIGLIPNCGASVILTELYLNNVISFASVVAGLLTGSGVALLILFKTNKNLKENLFILGLVYFIGAFSGLVIQIIEMFI